MKITDKNQKKMERERYSLLVGYLRDRGYVLESFRDQIVNFFEKSQNHLVVLYMRDYIANCMKLNMNSPEDRKAVWYEIASKGKDRDLRLKWVKGEIDPELDEVYPCYERFHSRHNGPGLAHIIDDSTPRIRGAITRTLNYINMMPPRRSKHSAVVNKWEVSDAMLACWEFVYSHPYYKSKKDINQHCMDEAAEEFGESLLINESMLPELLSMGKLAVAYKHPKFWTMLLFVYSTIDPIKNNNRAGTSDNHLKGVLDDQHPCFKEYWNLKNV